MHGSFTNVLWYLEFLAFAVLLICFFLFVLYLAKINYISYNPRYDTRKKIETAPKIPKKHIHVVEPNQRPICCDLGCIWFCRLFFSITTIAFCYYFAYSFISDTKLRFGLFVP
ncbi:hypothetical protein ABMA28_015120 [Loxostege sticticalis]|uniref:ATP synthase F0 subunit 8 n=1 Tax=Loxostege sticticalis TaxID=481309 RepID=A0ABD0TEE6_LOXSC